MYYPLVALLPVLAALLLFIAVFVVRVEVMEFGLALGNGGRFAQCKFVSGTLQSLMLLALPGFAFAGFPVIFPRIEDQVQPRHDLVD